MAQSRLVLCNEFVIDFASTSLTPQPFDKVAILAKSLEPPRGCGHSIQVFTSTKQRALGAVHNVH